MGEWTGRGVVKLPVYSNSFDRRKKPKTRTPGPTQPSPQFDVNSSFILNKMHENKRNMFIYAQQDIVVAVSCVFLDVAIEVVTVIKR